MKKENHREYDRFETDVKVYFYVMHGFNTTVAFKVVEREGQDSDVQYFGISRNISAGGICFETDKKLNKGDVLAINVFLPDKKAITIHMEGEVRWVREEDQKKGRKYIAGILLTSVEKNPVKDTIYYDEENKVIWSDVLESVFGTFRKLHHHTKASTENKSK